MALAAGLGAALAATLYFIRLDDEMRNFAASNVLPKERRMRLIKFMVGSAAGSVTVAATAMLIMTWRKRPILSVERWLWWLAPIGVLPGLSFAFEFRNWNGRSDALLFVAVF